MTEFAQLAQSVVINNTSYTVDDGRLADIDRKLAKIQVITPVGLAHLDRILARVLELKSQAQVDTPAIGQSIDQANGSQSGANVPVRPPREPAQQDDATVRSVITRRRGIRTAKPRRPAWLCRVSSAGLALQGPS